MAKKNRISSTIDCACVIHGHKYDWTYVERLYNQLQRHLSAEVRFHVYTEHHRSVPPHMIKHCLEDWPGVSGPKKSWWYKMHLFNTQHHAGPLLYFDLDCVIVRSIDSLVAQPSDQFWCIRDFKYLQASSVNVMNSSVMWWDTRQFEWVWDHFNTQGVAQVVKRYPGDQDFLQAEIGWDRRRYFDDQLFQSYRWQVADGGWDFVHRRPRAPGTGAQLAPATSVIVFHGYPKPHEVADPKIVQFWC